MRVTIIGATDGQELKMIQKLNPGFAESFHIVPVPEPSPEDTLLIVRDRMRRFAEGSAACRVFAFEESVDERLVELSGRFLRTRRYPGKALQLLDAVIACRSEDQQATTITCSDVETTVCRMSGLRPQIVRSDVGLSRLELQQALQADVIGQEEAVQAACDVILAYKAEMAPVGRPIAALFFAGPTGVGKTQLARSIAKYLFGGEEALLRYDMSEFAGGDGFAKLCGRRGSSEEPGRLVEDVCARPFSVVLFDEIEKAHDTVFNALLQVLGEGRMTDETGRTASFLNSIVIMTSNVGAHLFGQAPLGFARNGRREVSDEVMMKELEKALRPEFINRISRLMCFQPLDLLTVREIARREVLALAQRGGLLRRGIQIEVCEELLDHLAHAGYNKRYGARAMQRTVETVVTIPLGEMIAARPDLTAVRLLLGWDGEKVTVALR